MVNLAAQIALHGKSITRNICVKDKFFFLKKWMGLVFQILMSPLSYIKLVRTADDSSERV